MNLSICRLVSSAAVLLTCCFIAPAPVPHLQPPSIFFLSITTVIQPKYPSSSRSRSHPNHARTPISSDVGCASDCYGSIRWIPNDRGLGLVWHQHDGQTREVTCTTTTVPLTTMQYLMTLLKCIIPILSGMRANTRYSFSI
ncbi:hypothetical protein EJ05DRAFT_116069 [Pseudovirgaria hyperparasitica]|uniref:Ig-like domain-containing protein n=1 Tax=Pseudovirgaria hyperparasitica TaxID=470096 RepID=A0A6A6W1D9_9PEZI|nr:uncharacterized protein EJ05DRAFT_116069 [Pseudovirgaria hyperparasitica]KAF2755794.1 hypothetical protein EJ05DRAFT_116069 [Pseudovirgaria hyperparasitica]